jgi:hypothetical protein
MSSKATRGGPERPRGPSGSIAAIAHTRRGMEVTLRLRNEDTRPVHFISSVRTVLYDPAAKRLVVGLSDEGRAVIPGLGDIQPSFNFIDPGSETELRLMLPPRIVKLAPAGPPGSEVQFEEQHPDEAEEIVVKVAWSDTPYYEDPRDRAKDRLTLQNWPRGTSVIARKVDRRPRDSKD